ncbi:hypothetical protein EJB05_35093, partial [Eragrostis curvula]
MGAEQLLSPSPSAAADTGRASWAPHGRLLTACLVALNIFLVLLVYFYFWRFFTRRRSDGEDQDDAASSEAGSSPPASPKARDRREVERAITALPVFVHSSSSSSPPDGGSEAECAICIAEFADGEEGRLLPRCGHRFHARCVDTWFRFHTTCPLCRASVLLLHDAATTPAAAANRQSSDADTDCPV